MESSRFKPRQTLLAALVAATCCSPALAGKSVSWEDILNDDKTTGDVLSYGLGLKAQRFSPLAKINTKNVDHLVPAWSFSFGGEKQRGQEAQALVHDCRPSPCESGQARVCQATDHPAVLAAACVHSMGDRRR